MNAYEMRDFTRYLRTLTDRQVYGVLEKETDANRDEYAELARMELERRGLAESA